jgi:hypothetical protein
MFNDQFGNIDWKDADKIRQVIAKKFPRKSSDKAYQNAMKHSDKQNARIEHDKAPQRVLIELLLIIPNCSTSSATTPRLRSGQRTRYFLQPTPRQLHNW